MRTCLLIVVGIVVGAGCAASPRHQPPSQVTPPMDANSPGDSAFDELEAELAQKQVSVADPLEPVNRFMFGVNDVVYFWVLKPVLRAYVYAVSKRRARASAISSTTWPPRHAW